MASEFLQRGGKFLRSILSGHKSKLSSKGVARYTLSWVSMIQFYFVFGGGGGGKK